MAGRRLIAAPLLVASVVALACLSSTVDARGEPAATVYRLRPDPRMCPSPMCGGFWASRVNRTLTTCLDGQARASCYVATVDLSALAAASRAHARVALATATALVTGAFAHYESDTSPSLARLVAARVWIAAGPNRDTATVYRVVDTGLRCIRAPCFSLRATRVNRTSSTTLSGLDLAQVGASAAELRRAHAMLPSTGVLSSGVIRPDAKPGVPGVGRTLVATQFWLPA